MIERGTFGFELSCDSCPTQEEIDSPDHNWSDVTRFIRKNGWMALKANGKWVHTCPLCLEKDDDKDGGGMPDETW